MSLINLPCKFLPVRKIYKINLQFTDFTVQTVE